MSGYSSDEGDDDMGSPIIKSMGSEQPIPSLSTKSKKPPSKRRPKHSMDVDDIINTSSEDEDDDGGIEDLGDLDGDEDDEMMSGEDNDEDDENPYDENDLHTHAFDLQTLRQLIQRPNTIPLTLAQQGASTIPLPMMYPLTLHTNLEDNGIYPTQDFYDVQNEAYQTHLQSLFKCEVFLRRYQRDYVAKWKRRYRLYIQQLQQKQQNRQQDNEKAKLFNINDDKQQEIPKEIQVNPDQLKELMVREGVIQDVYQFTPFEPLNFVAVPSEGPIILQQQRLQLEYLDTIFGNQSLPQIFGLSSIKRNPFMNRQQQLQTQQQRTLQSRGLNTNPLLNSKGGNIGSHISFANQDHIHDEEFDSLTNGGIYSSAALTGAGGGHNRGGRAKKPTASSTSVSLCDGVFPQNPDGSWNDPIDGTLIDDNFMNHCVQFIEQQIEPVLAEILQEIKLPLAELSGIQITMMKQHLPELYDQMLALHREKCFQMDPSLISTSSPITATSSSTGSDPTTSSSSNITTPQQQQSGQSQLQQPQKLDPDVLPEINAAQSRLLLPKTGNKHIFTIFALKEMQYLAFILNQDSRKPILLKLNAFLWFLGWPNIRGRLKTIYTNVYGPLIDQTSESNDTATGTSSSAAATSTTTTGTTTTTTTTTTTSSPNSTTSTPLQSTSMGDGNNTTITGVNEDGDNAAVSNQPPVQPPPAKRAKRVTKSTKEKETASATTKDSSSTMDDEHKEQTTATTTTTSTGNVPSSTTTTTTTTTTPQQANDDANTTTIQVKRKPRTIALTTVPQSPPLASSVLTPDTLVQLDINSPSTMGDNDKVTGKTTNKTNQDDEKDNKKKPVGKKRTAAVALDNEPDHDDNSDMSDEVPPATKAVAKKKVVRKTAKQLEKENNEQQEDDEDDDEQEPTKTTSRGVGGGGGNSTSRRNTSTTSRSGRQSKANADTDGEDKETKSPTQDESRGSGTKRTTTPRTSAKKNEKKSNFTDTSDLEDNGHDDNDDEDEQPTNVVTVVKRGGRKITPSTEQPSAPLTLPALTPTTTPTTTTAMTPSTRKTTSNVITMSSNDETSPNNNSVSKGKKVGVKVMDQDSDDDLSDTIIKPTTGRKIATTIITSTRPRTSRGSTVNTTPSSNHSESNSSTELLIDTPSSQTYTGASSQSRSALTNRRSQFSQTQQQSQSHESVGTTSLITNTPKRSQIDDDALIVGMTTLRTRNPRFAKD